MDGIEHGRWRKANEKLGVTSAFSKGRHVAAPQKPCILGKNARGRATEWAAQTESYRKSLADQRPSFGRISSTHVAADATS